MKAAKKIPQHNTIKENRHQSNDKDDDDGVAGKVITVCEKRLIELICDCEYLFFGGDSLLRLVLAVYGIKRHIFLDFFHNK